MKRFRMTLPRWLQNQLVAGRALVRPKAKPKEYSR